MPSDSAALRSPAFASGGGALGAMIRDCDWSSTPLGPLERWPQALQTLVSVMLGANQPMFVAWGPELTLIYNDPYSQILGGKHPHALGRQFLEVWSEILADLTPIVEQAMSGRPVQMDDITLIMHRHGYPEETHFSFSYTPMRDDAGRVAGIFCACNEITAQVLAERRRDAEMERLRALFQRAPGFIGVMRGPELTFELANDALKRLLGGRDVTGLPLREAVPELQGQGFIEQIEDVCRTGRTISGQGVRVVLQRAPGGEPEEAFVDQVYAPVRDAAGAVTGVFVQGSDITERVRAEAAIRESEARFRNMADHAPVMMWVTEPDGSCSYLNRAWYAFTGQTEAEAEGFGWLDATHPDDKAEAERVFLEANARREAFRIEYRLRRADGVHRWAIDAASPRFGPDGEFLGYIGSVIDIDQRREAEERLRETSRRLDAILNNTTMAVFLMDHRQHCVYANAAAETLTGYAFADLQGRPLHDVVHHKKPDGSHYPLEECPIDRAFPARAQMGGEELFVAPDGSFYPVAFTASPVLDDGGRAIGTVIEARNITEEKARDAALQESEGRFRIMADSAPALIWASDTEARITFANRRYETDFGLPPERVVQEGWRRIVHPEDVDAFFSDFLDAFHARRDFRRDVRVFDKHGRLRWLRCEGTPRYDGAGAFLGYVGCNVDITEARLARDALEAEVEARTRELKLAEEQLRQAQKMEAVGQLTGGIAHDFNNLLQGITGSLDLVQKRIAQGRTGELDRFVAGAMTSANRAAALTHRLLAFSRRQPLDPKPVRVNPLIGSMEDLLRRTIGEHIELELVLAGGLWTTLCDPNQLESAILNLVINARDAMPDGGKLTVETCNAHLDNAYAARAREVSPGQYVCICVTDTGTGMTREVIERAFDPFFTTKPIGQGTGLGLSMIYGFARQSEGYAKIYSEVGQGTTVKIYLPRHRGDAAEEEAVPGLTEAHEAEQGEVVVVVEDEPVVRGLIVEVLGELGYTALEASDGPSGLELLRNAPRVDLLITDIGLPGLNGRQIADAARTRLPGLKVLFMTGYAENAAIANGFLEPGMSMITKPFAMESLATRVRDIIEGR